MKKLISSFAIFGAVVCANAGVVFTNTNFAGGDNVLAGDLTGPASTVTGHLNSDHSVLVDISSLNGGTMTYSGGAATLNGATGGLNHFAIEFQEGWSWDINNITISAAQAGSITLTAYTVSDGSFSSTLTYKKNGAEHFTADADSISSRITRLEIQTTTDLDYTKQIRFGAAAPAPVPEPASMAVLGIGALGLIRRRRNKNA